ncbi:MAG: type II toxin-antitoxin system VapC family toxin [Solirubrobacterales bacterium]
MALTLVDTSVWVDYFRYSGPPKSHRLAELIATDESVAVTEPVAMELLAGVRDPDRRGKLRKLLVRFDHLAFESTIDFAEAASIYRQCRASGFTPQNHVDCMIAAVAMRNDVQVLANDVDFERIAHVTGLKLALN